MNKYFCHHKNKHTVVIEEYILFQAKCKSIKIQCAGDCPCKPIKKNCVGTHLYMSYPVCGENEQTYSNPYEIKCYNQRIECPGRCPCLAGSDKYANIFGD